MASKRATKKRISYVCGELASDILLASHFTGVDRAEVNKIINEIATLQEESRAKVTFSFDKAVRDFESKAAYNKARSAYNKAAFAQLRKEFAEKANAIVKEMNAAIPADVRKSVAELS